MHKKSIGKVRTVVIDMWETFEKGGLNYFPSACIVIDKYNLIHKRVTRALDDVRKKVPDLKKCRITLIYTFKRMEKLKDKQIEKLIGTFEENPEISHAYNHKESFRKAPHIDTVDSLFDEWL